MAYKDKEDMRQLGKVGEAGKIERFKERHPEFKHEDDEVVLEAIRKEKEARGVEPPKGSVVLLNQARAHPVFAWGS